MKWCRVMSWSIRHGDAPDKSQNYFTFNWCCGNTDSTFYIFKLSELQLGHGEAYNVVTYDSWVEIEIWWQLQGSSPPPPLAEILDKRLSKWHNISSSSLYYTNASSILLNNPLRPIGSPVTHVNWPMNWPDFAASPARLRWPARSRYIVACMHRFSHILGIPPEPAVWFMSESRAVANRQARI